MYLGVYNIYTLYNHLPVGNKTSKGLTGLGRFDSINSYLIIILASSYGLGYMSSFSDPLFTVLLFCMVRHVPK